MKAWAIAVLGFYYAALAGLGVYGLHRLFLVWILRRRRPGLSPGPVPRVTVTIQLPLYNEIHVIDRLVEAACSIRHPRELLEIQILDDSTDETAARAAALAEIWRARGVDIVCLHRGNRNGFKAGALAAGLEAAKGGFIAIFDADFVPPPDFLEKTLPRFVDGSVGMVQARWEHLNRDWSLFTRAQALLLDGHFIVEQAARSASGRFFNFNGTAGVFRRECIEDAGGWKADTLTEDLDLSYRAQMSGWRFVFIHEPACPAELPVEMNALRSQQHRWTKGSIQTAMKLLPAIFRMRLPWQVKAEAFLHLTNNAAYLLLLAAAMLLVPSLIIRREMGWMATWPDLGVFLAGTGSFLLFCAVSQRFRAPFLGTESGKSGARHSVLRTVADFPAVMALGAGLSLNNAVAVLEALAGSTSEFRRTPKYRIGERGETKWQSLAYRGDPTRLVPIELLLTACFSAASIWAFVEKLYTSIPFLLFFAAGYGAVAGLTIVQRIGSWRQAKRLFPAPAES